MIYRNCVLREFHYIAHTLHMVHLVLLFCKHIIIIVLQQVSRERFMIAFILFQIFIALKLAVISIKEQLIPARIDSERESF